MYDLVLKGAKKILDVSGVVVLPGAADHHVHMHLPTELDAIAIVHAEARALSAPLVVK